MFEDFCAKFFAQLILNIAVRIIGTLWSGPRADEIIHALYERLLNSGAWAAASSAVTSIGALACGSTRFASALVYAISVQICFTLALHCAMQLGEVTHYATQSALIQNIESVAFYALSFEVAYLFATLVSRLAKFAESHTGVSLAWPATAFLFALYSVTHIVIFKTTYTTFSMALNVVLIVWLACMTLSRYRVHGFAESAAIRFLDRRSNVTSSHL